MFSQEVTLLHEIMAAYPHRNPNCNKLDEFIAKMEGFRKRYQQIIDVMPPEKAAELLRFAAGNGGTSFLAPSEPQTLARLTEIAKVAADTETGYRAATFSQLTPEPVVEVQGESGDVLGDAE